MVYNMKRGSADGRRLVWKISAEMIASRPHGYGYGLFEKYYNLHQAEYFEQNNATETEIYHSDYISMPYNDYLEHCVEGGFIGLGLLICFYFILIKKALRQHDVISASVVSAFAVMSLTNFVYSAIQPWFLLMIVCAFVAADDKSVTRYKRALDIMLFPVILLCGVVVFYMIKSQIKLAAYKEQIVNGRYVSQENIMSLYPYIGTSEAYWTISAYHMLLEKNNIMARQHLNKALCFTSSPQTLELAYYAYRQSGMEDKGIIFIHTQSNMMPMLLKPKSLLMEYYYKRGDMNKALSYANGIVSTPHKIDNAVSDSIRNKAHKLTNIIKTIRR